MNLTSVIAQRKTKTVYRDGDRKIKLFVKDYPKADVLNEALNQAALLSANTPAYSKQASGGCLSSVGHTCCRQRLFQFFGSN
jgi:hypothetical protein